MKQGILITAYKHINQLFNLLDSLDSDFYAYIHFDKKSKLTRQQTQSIINHRCVVYLSRKYHVNWGGFNHLKSILHLVREGLKDTKLEYFHLISGQDYPLLPNPAITRFLNENKGKQYLEYFELPSANWPNQGKERLENYNFYDWFNAKVNFQKELIYSLLKFQWKFKIKRAPPKEVKTLYGGSTWWTLNIDCLRYVTKFLDEHPDFLKRFKYSFCSEEILFQTIILNSPFKDSVVNDNLRYIVWEERNGSYPAILDESDLDKLNQSTFLFGRKFEAPFSNRLLQMIKGNEDFAS